MKVSVIQENLSKALNVVSRVVGNRSSLAVLSNVLLKANLGRLEVIGTNLEIAIVYQVGAKVETDGSLSVPARLLTELINSLPSDKLLLNAAAQNLHIKTTNFESTINGIASEEFPNVPVIKPTTSLSFPAATLVTALSQVGFAAAVDESRPVLSGVVFSVRGKELLLAATDSYRLAESVVALTQEQKADADFIVPAKTVNELIRILSQYEGDVEVGATETEIEFNMGDIRLVSRLIEGKFPDYKKIIPDKNETEAVVDTAELLSTIKVAGLFARETANTIKLTFEAGKLSISSSAAQVGENQSSLETKLVGDPGEISLNAKYLLDVLTVVKTPTVKLGISGKLNPCLVTPVKGEQDTSYRHIIMPLRS
ncbi:DNA polymerase III subunit beta [bacterium]|nr:DNA polymerase III subunit beta [bacterium]